MRMYDIIAKKRDNKMLTEQEIAFVIKGFTAEKIPDYQMSAFLMAVYFNGMTENELALFTHYMAISGDMIDLSSILGKKADKHSTGGVGDKTTLIVAPIVAACGVNVAKMSGRGLGHTGGTVDKLESIPNFKTTLTQSEFFSQVNKIGISVIGQSGNLAPADKKIYALRDVTATVSSIPLIASSIMSKKLAAGSDIILLDVKVGNGAFMKTMEDAIALATAMVSIGENNNRNTAAVITDMGIPLGYAIGNSLEVAEAVDVLCDKGPQDLKTVCLELAAKMLELADKGTYNQCLQMANNAIKNKSAFKKFCEMVVSQGGDVSVLHDTKKLCISSYKHEVFAQKSGYIYNMDTEKIGITGVMLGAGRVTKESKIDYGAGILLFAKTGDRVERGDLLATFYANDKSLFKAATENFLSALTFNNEVPNMQNLILANVDKNGVTYK